MNNRTPRERLTALKKELRNMDPTLVLRVLFEIAEAAIRENEDLKREAS